MTFFMVSHADEPSEQRVYYGTKKDLLIYLQNTLNSMDARDHVEDVFTIDEQPGVYILNKENAVIEPKLVKNL